MPREPMKFCASMSKCSQAYTIGKPGTVKIAADRAPIDEEKINKLLAFLADKLSEDDFAELSDMIDDVVDAAEEENPTEQMAQDAHPASTRRAIRRAHRNIRLGFDARPPGLRQGTPRVAEDSALARMREAVARVGTDPYEVGRRDADRRGREVRSTEAQTAGFYARFPGAAKIG